MVRMEEGGEKLRCLEGMNSDVVLSSWIDGWFEGGRGDMTVVAIVFVCVDWEI